jgi:hypothetical protein
MGAGEKDGGAEENYSEGWGEGRWGLKRKTVRAGVKDGRG